MSCSEGYLNQLARSIPTLSTHFRCNMNGSLCSAMDSENCEQTTASTFEIIAEKDRRRLSRRDLLKKFKCIILVACLLLIVTGITVVLVVFLTRKGVGDSQTVPREEGSSSNKTVKKTNAHEILTTFLLKVHDAYHEVHDSDIASKINATRDEVLEKIRPFEVKPTSLKRVADMASQLRSELDSLFTEESEATLTQRELRALYELKTFLRYFTEGPYDSMYYTGDWMLGPNTMAWEPIGTSMLTIRYLARYIMQPRSVEEAERFIELLKDEGASIARYMENMKMGVAAGMVRNIEACRGGLLRFKSHFHWAQKGSLESIGVKSSFFKYFTDKTQKEWIAKYGKNYTTSLEEAAIRFVAKPLTDLIRYIETEHLQHCVPSDVSSGLASLPLSYVYVNGTPDLSQPTHPYLPSGERLNGSKAFVQLLTYFTTNGITPKEIRELGQTKLEELYGKALAVARQVTNETNTTVAVKKFRALMTHRSQYFNNQSFPVNESIENAFLKCYDEASARKHCPRRWEALTKWQKSSESINKILHEKIKPLFYTHGRKKTTISAKCRIAVKPNFDPCSSYHNYQLRGCGIHYIPFFVDNYGPKFSEWTTTAHETEPGHDLEVKGYAENFKDTNKDVIQWLSYRTYFSGFSEGWAMYAESPLTGGDVDAYRDDLMSKYGMLQQEIIAALRLIIETGLHFYGMSRSEALKLFDDYAWDNSDIAHKEITRYQSLQGHSVSYMVGQTALLKARTFAEKELGSNFSLPEFHYQVLHQGELTLDYLDTYIHHYVACVKSNKDPKGQSCDDILG